MSLSDLAAIAEVTASVGVIASLLFLAIQIRKASAVDNSSNILETVKALSNWAKEFSKDEEWMNFCLRGLEDYESLSEQERLRFNYAMNSIVILVESVVLSEKLGVIGKEELAAGSSWVETFAKKKGFRDWWRARGRNTFTSTFVEFVEGLDQFET